MSQSVIEGKDDLFRLNATHLKRAIRTSTAVALNSAAPRRLLNMLVNFYNYQMNFVYAVYVIIHRVSQKRRPFLTNQNIPDQLSDDKEVKII